MKPSIKKANHSGCRHPGTSLFWYQRLTSILLIFLGSWFVYALLTQVPAAYFNTLAWVQIPFNTVSLGILIVIMIFHGQLGLQVIIEDYIHHPTFKIITIRSLKLISFLLIICSLVLLIKIQQLPLPAFKHSSIYQNKY